MKVHIAATLCTTLRKVRTVEWRIDDEEKECKMWISDGHE